MADNGAGSYTLPQPPFTSGTTISSAAVNSNFSDLATALNNRLTRNGENAASANLPMAGFRHTGVGNASARTQYAAAGQVQDSALVWGGTSTGSANAHAIDLAPGISAYVAGQRFAFLAGYTTTGAATLAVSGLAAKPLVFANGAPVGGGALIAGGLAEVMYDGTSFRLIGPDASTSLTGDASLATVTSAGSTTERTLAERFRDTVKVRDEGAVGNGTTDDTAAIQSAWTKAANEGKCLEFEEGDFRITAPMAGKPVLWLAERGRTKLIFDTMAGLDAITFQDADVIGAEGGMIGFELVAKGANGGTCVSMPKASSQYSTYFTRWTFQDLYCRGENRNTAAYSFAWDYGFAKWLRLSDCVGLDVEHITIQGQWDIKLDPAGQFEDCGIELDAAGAILTARISDITFGPIHTAIKVGSNAFFSLETGDLIGTHRGIDQTGTTVFNEPKIAFCNINAQEYGIYCDGTDSREIFSVTIRRHRDGWKGATHDWYGIKAIDCSDLKIGHCTVQPDEGGGAFTGTMTGYHLEGCSLGPLSGNFVGVGCDFGITLDNCTGGAINNTITAQSNAANVLFNLTNNTRRTTIGLYQLVSSFAGTVLQKDSTIVGAITMLNDSFDLQSTGNVVMDLTRVNAAADTKKWRTTVGTSSLVRQVVNDAGSGTSFELVTRTGTTIDQIEWRATDLFLNLGGLLLINADFVVLPVLANHVNDAAAAAAGVPVQGVYRNGSVVMIRVV